MGEDALDNLVRPALAAQDRLPVLRVLIERGMDLVVEVVQEGGRAPELFVLAEAPRVRAHRGLDRERMAEERLALRVTVQRLPGALSGGVHRAARIAPSQWPRPPSWTRSP